MRPLTGRPASGASWRVAGAAGRSRIVLAAIVPPEPGPSPAQHTVDVATHVDIVDQWGRDSFPASDPPANW